MKIVAIRGENLASLEDFDVKLDGEWMESAGIFAITGPTGSGKSTILDAVSLALYDQTPRLQGRSRVKINPLGESAEISSNDPRLLLRKGTGEGWAEVEFVAADGRRYRTRWSVHRARSKPDGNLQSQDLRFWAVDPEDPGAEPDELTGATKTETLGLIEEKLGLSFDQFGRSVLLAQGDFAAFVKASDGERAELLERMTNTSIYGELSKAAYARAQAEAEAIERLEARADEQEVLDDEERAAHEVWAEAAAGRVEGLEAEIEEARGQVAWFEELEGLTAKADAAKEGLEAAQKAWEESAELREELADVEEVAELRTPYTQLQGWREEHESCEEALGELHERKEKKTEAAGGLAKALGEKAKALEEAREARKSAEAVLQQARGLDREIAHAEEKAKEASKAREGAAIGLKAIEGEQEELAKTLGELDHAIGAHVGWQETHRHVAAVAEDRGLHLKALAELAQAQGEIAGSDASRAALSERLEALRAAEAALAEEVSTKKSGLAQQKDALAARKAAAPAKGLEALQAERREVDGAKKGAEAALRQVVAILAMDLELAGLEEARVGLGRQEESAVEALEGVGDALKTLRGRLEAERRALSAWQAAKSLDEHRRRLVEGEVCPLCGAEEHPWREEGAPDPAREVAAQGERIEGMEGELRGLQRREGELAAQKSQVEEKLRALDARATALGQEREGALEAWAEARGEDQEQPDEAAKGALEARIVALEEALTEVEARYEVMSKELQAIEAAQVALDAAELELSGLEGRLGDEREALRGAAGELEKVEGRLKAAREKRAEARGTLEAPFADWPEWPRAFELDPVGFQAACAEQVTRWIETREALVALREEHRAASQTRDDLARRGAEKSEELERRVEAAKGADAALEALRGQRAEVLGGRPADEVQGELERAITEAEEAREEARAAKSELEGEIDRLNGQIAEKIDVRDGLKKRLEEQGAVLDARLDELFLDRAILAARLERDEAWVKRTRAAIQEEKSGLEAARKLVEERGADLAGYREAKPEPRCSREEAKARWDGLKGELEALRSWRNELARVLANDREARRKRAEITDQLEAQRARHAVWEELGALIGSGNGNNFRRYAQSLTLEVLLGYANGHLARLKPRYRLQRIPKPNDHSQLSLQVVDRDMGDDIRSIESLSGGETFLVSLALALGLSSLTSNHTRVDSLFIDEGFGSLDAESLEVAITTLDTLQSEGRTVGVISHVHGLAERIGKQIRVVPRGDGRSYIEYVAGK